MTALYKKSREPTENLMSPAFLLEDAEVKEVPSTGMEYLHKMIAEREACPDLALLNYESKQTLFFKEPPGPASASPTLKPTIQWQHQQITDFYDNRIHVIAHSLSQPPVNTTIYDIESLPSIDLRTQQPNLKLMLQFKQEHLDALLDIILNTVLDKVKPGQGIEQPIGEWIYAILIRQSNPMLSETSCLVRSLARRCAEIRSHLKPEDPDALELAMPLNLFICIVARYYREVDLAD